MRYSYVEKLLPSSFADYVLDTVGATAALFEKCLLNFNKLILQLAINIYLSFGHTGENITQSLVVKITQTLVTHKEGHEQVETFLNKVIYLFFKFFV